MTLTSKSTNIYIYLCGYVYIVTYICEIYAYIYVNMHIYIGTETCTQILPMCKHPGYRFGVIITHRGLLLPACDLLLHAFDIVL